MRKEKRKEKVKEIGDWSEVEIEVAKKIIFASCRRKYFLNHSINQKSEGWKEEKKLFVRAKTGKMVFN